MKKITAILMSLVIVLGLAACGQSGNDSGSGEGGAGENVGERTVTDVYGREVTIPEKVESIVCVGSGALRMAAYLDLNDMLVGVEEADREYETSTKRDYAHYYYDVYSALPVIGKGGGTSYTAYPEEILTIMPDVIISSYQQEAAEQLQNETGIPVVCVRYTSTDFINESFYTGMRLLAEVTGSEERCEEILSFIDGCKADLNDRTKDVPDSEKPRVYTGAVTFSGAHGFSGTYANFGPFMAINAINVADETGETGSFDVDLEKVLEWDPDIIFLDPGNMNLVEDEYRTNPSFFESLRAVQEGEIYAMPSFNNYSTNVTYAIIGAYYAGTVLYPEQFADIDIAEKADEILKYFFGEGYYDEMVADNMGYGKLTLG